MKSTRTIYLSIYLSNYRTIDAIVHPFCHHRHHRHHRPYIILFIWPYGHPYGHMAIVHPWTMVTMVTMAMAIVWHQCCQNTRAQKCDDLFSHLFPDLPCHIQISGGWNRFHLWCKKAAAFFPNKNCCLQTKQLTGNILQKTATALSVEQKGDYFQGENWIQHFIVIVKKKERNHKILYLQEEQWKTPMKNLALNSLQAWWLQFFLNKNAFSTSSIIQRWILRESCEEEKNRDP